MNRKSIYFKLLTVLLCTTFLIACGTNSASQTDMEAQSAANASNFNAAGKDIGTLISELVVYDDDDLYTDWKNENPNYIELNGTNADIKGSGAEVKDSKITITAAGVYVLSGKLDNGQVIVAVQDKGTVRLVLNSATINSTDNSPIYVKNAGKTILTLQDGTENFISDGTKYVLADAAADEPNAAIFSQDSLTINGNGTVTVRGNYNNGITSKDELKITGGNIQITSVDDGLLGRDMLAVKDGNISIEAGGDGIKSTNDTDTAKGIVAVEGGSFDIKSENDGIQAETSMLIAGGTFNISSGGGSVNGEVKVDEGMKGMKGGFRPDSNTAASANAPEKQSENTTATTTTTATEKESAKALKAAGDILINGGTFHIDSADDSIHSNSGITIADGDFSITSGDDGIHANATISITGGKINITKSYEGIESAVVTISAGEIHVTASDDGINIAGGNDESSVNGRPGQNNFSASGDNRLNISGGNITVDAAGDGLDSGGAIYMSGGTVLVNGPTGNNNGALDYDGSFEMTGGFLIAAGSAGMAQATSEQSAQYSVIMTYSEVQQAGTIVHLEDSEGKAVMTFAPKKNYQTVVISSPELKKASSYTLYSGGTSTGSETDGLYSGGQYKEGTKIVDFTISDSVTWLSETGVTEPRSFNPGGHNPDFKRGQNPPQDGVPPVRQ